MNFLQQSMFNRYFWFARWTDYLNRERLWRWLLIPEAGLLAFGYGQPWSPAIIMGCLLLIRWSARIAPERHGSITDWTFYSTYIEFVFWFFWFGVGLEVVAALIGGINIGDAAIASGDKLVVLQALSNAFGITIHTYLLADIFAPPRPRKKVKVSIKMPVRLALPEAA